MTTTSRTSTLAAVSAVAFTLLISPAAVAQQQPSGRLGGSPPASMPHQPAPSQAVPPTHGDPACTITGTRTADRLLGTPGDDVICGGRGPDRISGRGGNDIIRGGPGADRIDAGAGADTIAGGAGRDRIDGGPGVDKALKGSGERLRSVERVQRTDLLTRSAAAYAMGPAACFDHQGGVLLHQTPPAATADHFEWIEHWNAVAYWNGAGWIVDDTSWVGPFWMRTDYPEWFYHQGSWRHADQGGGSSTTHLGLGGAYAPVQWIGWHQEGATTFQFAPVSQEYYGVPMNEGAGYCTT